MKKGTFAIKNKLHVTRYALRIMLITLMALFSLCQTSNAANVFLNSYPSDITINDGDPLSIPIFFEGGDLTGHTVELFVWLENATDKTDKLYLANDGKWTPFSNYSEMSSAGQASMPQYYNVIPPWTPLQDTHGLPSFSLNICLNGNVGGLLNEGVNTAGASCGTRNINVIRTCTGVYISPASISATAVSGQTATSSLSIKNSCNNPIDFTAQTSDSWIGMSKATGVLNITLNSTGLSTGAHTGSISISSGDITKTVSVSFTVTSDSGSGSSCPFPIFCSGSGGGGSGGGGSGGGGSGGGGTTCTPASISVSPPGSVSFTGTAGGSVTPQTVYVTNNCSGTITFTATKASGGSWLTVSPPSGNNFTVSANTTDMSGTSTGSITISASGYSSVTLNVTLTISGSCQISSAVLNPSSISQTVNVGATASSVTVSVKDNCGNALLYGIASVTNPNNFFSVAVPTTQTGFTVNFPTAFSTAVTNTGSITVSSSFGNTTFPVTVNVVQASSGTDNATVLTVRTNVKFSVPALGSALFKFSDNGTSANNNLLQVSLDCMNQTVSCASNAVVKYAGANCEFGPATMDDYNLAASYASPTYNSSQHTYSPPRARWDLYYNMMKTGSNELIVIGGDNSSQANYPDEPHGCYYVFVYNPTSWTNPLVIGWSDLDIP